MMIDPFPEFTGLIQKSNNTSETAKASYARTNIVLGCFLAIIGNLTISISLNVQKYVHVRIGRSETHVSYWRLPLWWLGICLMILGECGNFVALGLAPASLIAPLGTTTVIANMLIVVIFLKEKLRPDDIFGTTLALIGAFMTITFSSDNQTNLSPQDLTNLLTRLPFIIYICVEIVILIILSVLYHRFGYDNLVIVLGICEVYASVSIITAKGVSTLLSSALNGHMVFHDFVIYVFFILLCISGVVQVIYLNRAMQLYYSAVVVPTHFVLFTITAIIAGVIYYQEFSGHNSLQIFMFLFGCLLSCIGVYFIQQDKGAYSSAPKDNKASKMDDDDTQPIVDNSEVDNGGSSVPNPPSDKETPNDNWINQQTIPTYQQMPNKG